MSKRLTMFMWNDTGWILCNTVCLKSKKLNTIKNDRLDKTNETYSLNSQEKLHIARCFLRNERDFATFSTICTTLDKKIYLDFLKLTKSIVNTASLDKLSRSPAGENK